VELARMEAADSGVWDAEAFVAVLQAQANTALALALTTQAQEANAVINASHTRGDPQAWVRVGFRQAVAEAVGREQGHAPRESTDSILLSAGRRSVGLSHVC